MTDCEYCRRSGHVWFQCPKKPDGWKPERLAKKNSLPHAAGSETNARGSSAVSRPDSSRGEAGATPAMLKVAAEKPKRKDTRKGDRHSPGYMAKYMREYRAKLKVQNMALSLSNEGTEE